MTDTRDAIEQRTGEVVLRNGSRVLTMSTIVGKVVNAPADDLTAPGQAGNQ
jgi:preprotein translocase subunit YajC